MYIFHEFIINMSNHLKTFNFFGCIDREPSSLFYKDLEISRWNT